MIKDDSQNIDCGLCVLRPWHRDDEALLSRIASDRNVSRYMTARFPYPYTLEDAREWISRCNESGQPTNYSILVDGELAGGCGYEVGQLEWARSAEIGYWLSPRYWGKGIATAAFGRLTDHALRTPQILRLQATIHSPNRASARVAEKCGYIREAVLHNAISKDGAVYDALIYAKLR